MLIKITSLLIAIYVISGCMSKDITGGTTSLSDLQKISTHQLKSYSRAEKHLKDSAIQDTAAALSTQSGLAFRAKQITELLEHNAQNLDQTFNFNSMLIDNEILSPILVEAKDTVHQSNNTTFRISDIVYRIDQQARFVTNAPHWRDYLTMSYEYPGMPDSTLLPKSSHEQHIWSQYVDKGWNNGIKQANSIFSEKMNKLKRDFSGMILYRKLLSQGIMSKPYVATANLGITGNELEVRVNDKIKKITSLPVLKTDAMQWNPVVEK